VFYSPLIFIFLSCFFLFKPKKKKIFLKMSCEVKEANSPQPARFPPVGDYGWKEMHEDLENERFAGTYGADNAAFHGLAGVRAGVDMAKFHSKRSPHEFYVPALEQLLNNPKTRARWNDIITFDPLGMFATRPTIAATTACMLIPELTNLESDAKIVNEDKSINCVKAAIDYVWNLPALAARLQMDETVMRKALAESTQNDTVSDPKLRAYMPPVGGFCVYFIGDISKLADPSTEVAVRCHDACCGSDVFGTDICTCRPYLVYAIQGAVETAKRGGVGIIAYFRKEGRSLGEVTKFRVYNARKGQPGGDTAENYFKQTESIAGIRDARFQEMMPDVLSWLGVSRIDWLLSMSSDKYDAIVGAGIEVMQRVALPDMYVPKGAVVEITAKISAGYHTDVLVQEDIIDRLRSLDMIRERCGKIFALAKSDHAKHFRLDMAKLSECADFVISTTKSNYPTLDIPYHSRWRHFSNDSVEQLSATWPCDAIEKARRLLDLVTVSVLLDAGAGQGWHYIDTEGKTQTRSEGLAIATFDMFKDGLFSSDSALPHRVNALGLKNMELKHFTKGFQVGKHNPMVGLEGRFGLLKRLGKALKQHEEYFGKEVYRPGHIVDYVLKHAKNNRVSLRVLWKAVIEGFESIWPENHSGVRRGDVWVYSPLKQIGTPASDMIPFHKLSQWLTYSLLEPIQALGIHFDDMDLLTGLAEYRNGGLFIDTGVLVPRKDEYARMEFDVGSELVVEWRALTICLVDEVAEIMRNKLGMNKESLPLAKVLQGGTWAAGRIAASRVRHDRTAPISVRSDGTVF